MNDVILSIKNLSKSYQTVKAVDDISFDVKRGNFFAFLGPNGAGKSTTIKMITTLLKPDKGIITLNGHEEPDYIRTKLGVVFQDNVLDKFLTVKENLLSRGQLYLSKEDSYKRYEFLKDLLDLSSIENQLFKTLSGGQKRRCEIARALFSNPEILLLDEPTTGLDPETRQSVWQLIHQLRSEQDITIILTTHYMEEAANADQIMIIHQGKIVASGTPVALKTKYSLDHLYIVPKDIKKLEDALNKINKAFQIIADQYKIVVNSLDETLKIIDLLKDNMLGFQAIKGNLDDVFLNVIGEQHA